MGYQEYIFKITDIDKAKENKEKIQNYLRKKNYHQNSLTLMRFDKELDQIETGYHFYITGCRHYGRDLLFRLGEILEYGGNCIEDVYNNFSEKKDNLADIFKKGKTKYGEVLESWSEDLGDEDIGKYELEDLWLDNDDYELFLNCTTGNFIIELNDGETIESKFKEILKTYINSKKVSMISIIETDNKYVTNILYNHKNRWNEEFMTLRNTSIFTDDEIEEQGIATFINGALDSFKVVNVAVFEQIADNKFILVR